MCENGKRALALGYFDGLHIAHIKVLEAVINQKKNRLIPGVLLFDGSPARILSNVDIPRLMSEEDRDETLKGMGLETVKISFSDIKDMSPEAFVADVLKKKLDCGFVSCGYNYTFGKNGAGNTDILKALCSTHSIVLSVCDKVTLNGETVSSTAIRLAVKSGEMKKAVEMLSRPLSFVSTVFSGDKRGRLLGFPTINQFLPENFIVPKFGVYASLARFDGKTYPAVTNIGSRPTFSGTSVRSETHIIGFSGDLYNKEVRISLVDFLREEIKFESADSLIAQIGLDAENALKALTGSNYF